MIETRPAREGDIPALMNIYNHYIREAPATFDIEEKDAAERGRWLAQFSDTGPYRIFVADDGGTVIGYAYSARFGERAAYATSIETSIYLAPDVTGKGVGSRLYTTLFEAIKGEDLHRAYAGITLPNDASRRLHERFRFREVGIYREVGRKFGKFWDVGWFERELG